MELTGFLEGAHYRGLLSNPTIYTTSPSLDEAFCVADGGSFRLSHDLFHSTLLNSIHFSCLSQFILKMEHFHYISVENHMWKYDQEGSFGLT